MLIDPVLGDNGSPYGPITKDLITGMTALIAKADVVTPNPTEAALLLHEPWEKNLSVERAVEWAERIAELGPSRVVVTGLQNGSEGSVICHDRLSHSSTVYSHRYAPINFPGSGDLFASILCGLMMNGVSFFEAVRTSATLTGKAIFASWESHVERRHGVEVEAIIGDLSSLVSTIVP